MSRSQAGLVLKYNGNPNFGLVWYSNGEKQVHIQMASEYRMNHVNHGIQNIQILVRCLNGIWIPAGKNPSDTQRSGIKPRLKSPLSIQRVPQSIEYFKWPISKVVYTKFKLFKHWIPLLFTGHLLKYNSFNSCCTSRLWIMHMHARTCFTCDMTYTCKDLSQVKYGEIGWLMTCPT